MAFINLQFAQVRKLFFDAKSVKAGLGSAEQKALSKAGAAVMARARASIKEAAGPREVSKPGKPPLSKTGLLKKNIFFYYDKGTGSVVVGPIKISSKASGVPRVLEEGGKSTATFLDKTTNQLVTKPTTIAARPYMLPAFKNVRHRFAAMFHGAV